ERLAMSRMAREGLHTAPGLVFRSPRGLPIQERNLARVWERFRRHFPGAEIRALRLHDARHTFASHALEAGVSVRRVAAWLGHSRPETTLRIYAHVVPEAPPIKGFLAPREGEKGRPPQSLPNPPQRSRKSGARDGI